MANLANLGALRWLWLCLLAASAVSELEGALAPRNPSRYYADLDARNQVVRSPLPYVTTNLEDLPSSLDWRDMQGISFVTRVGNQMVPRGCGSCWAFSAAASVSDRIKVSPMIRCCWNGKSDRFEV